MHVNLALSALVIDAPTMVRHPSRVHRQHCLGNNCMFHTMFVPHARQEPVSTSLDH